MTDSSLRIIIWNSNGLALRSKDLEVFLKYKYINMALISKTHFISKNYLKISGFTVYHITHPSGRAHTGTAIIIKNSVKHFPQEEIRQDFLQATIITVQYNNADLNTAAAYCPPRYNI